MTVTRDVINDLLPLYAAGEASPDTVALVDEYLVHHPELAEAIEALRMDPLSELAVQLQPNKEKETLNMTKKLLRLRGTLMGLGIFLTCTIASFGGRDGHITWTFIQVTSTPVIGLVVVAALASWVGFFAVRRRLEHTGL